MGHDEAADLLQETLDEEKAADEKLSPLAEGGINQDAADAAHPANEEEEEATKTPRSRPVRAPMRKTAGAGRGAN